MCLDLAIFRDFDFLVWALHSHGLKNPCFIIACMSTLGKNPLLTELRRIAFMSFGVNSVVHVLVTLVSAKVYIHQAT